MLTRFKLNFSNIYYSRRLGDLEVIIQVLTSNLVWQESFFEAENE